MEIPLVSALRWRGRLNPRGKPGSAVPRRATAYLVYNNDAAFVEATRESGDGPCGAKRPRREKG